MSWPLPRALGLIAVMACSFSVAWLVMPTGVAFADTVACSGGDISCDVTWTEGPGTNETTLVVHNTASAGGQPISDFTFLIAGGPQITAVSGGQCSTTGVSGQLQCLHPLYPGDSETITITTASPVASGTTGYLTPYDGGENPQPQVNVPLQDTTNCGIKYVGGLLHGHTVGHDIDWHFTFSGGTPPYKITLVSGRPIGTRFYKSSPNTVRILGFAADAGKYDLVFHVVDANNCAADVTVHEEIAPEVSEETYERDRTDLAFARIGLLIEGKYRARSHAPRLTLLLTQTAAALHTDLRYRIAPAKTYRVVFRNKTTTSVTFRARRGKRYCFSAKLHSGTRWGAETCINAK